MHPNDRLYLLERAVELAEQHDEPRYVVLGLMEMRDRAKREARDEQS